MLIGHADVKVYKGCYLLFNHLIGNDRWRSTLYKRKSIEELEKDIREARKRGMTYINQYGNLDILSAEIVNQCKITIIEVWQKQ